MTANLRWLAENLEEALCAAIMIFMAGLGFLNVVTRYLGFSLAYTEEVPVNWCEGLGTVLANEEVIDGRSEVGGFPVERRPMRQWLLRITAYADRLLADLRDEHSLLQPWRRPIAVARPVQRSGNRREGG